MMRLLFAGVWQERLLYLGIRKLGRGSDASKDPEAGAMRRT